MANPVAKPVPKKVIRIFGLMGHLPKDHGRKHSLNIKYHLDDRISPGGAGLRLDKDLVGAEPLHLPMNPLELEEGSKLKLEITENHSFLSFLSWFRRSAIATAETTFNQLWRHLISTAGVNPTQHFEFDLGPEYAGLQIWIVAESHETNLFKDTQEKLQNSKLKLKEMKTALDHMGGARDVVETALKVGTIISELHPIAKSVSTSVNVVYEQFKAQDQSHKQMLDLAEDMERMIMFVQRVKKVPKLEMLEQILDDFSGLMVEVVEFIEHWLRSGMANFFSTTSDQGEISGFKGRLTAFKEGFNRGLQIDLASSFAQSEDASLLREKLLRGHSARERRATGCMAGTRSHIIEKVMERLESFDDADNNIILIKGNVGTGKSALASSIVTLLNEQHRCASHFAFQRDSAAATTPEALWFRLAFDLASHFISARECILRQLDPQRSPPEALLDLTDPDIKKLFAALVEKPLRALFYSDDFSSNQSLVVVVDALDECGGLMGQLERERLLETLLLWPKLPKNFKLVVTSRPEYAITRKLSSIGCSDIEIPSGADPQSARDIHMYFANRLEEIMDDMPLPPGWVQGNAHKLAERAAGVFQWAVVAARFIERDNDPKARTEKFADGAPDSDGMADLYSYLLENAFGGAKGENTYEEFKTVVGAVLLAKRPLKESELAELPKINQTIVSSIRMRLHSVVDHDSTTTLRFAHQSFLDFVLFSDKCPQRFSLKGSEPEQHRRLVDLCLTHLKSLDDTGDNTPLPLYACRFWVDHLVPATFDDVLAEKIENVIDEKFFVWIKIMHSETDISSMMTAVETLFQTLEKKKEKAFSIRISSEILLTTKQKLSKLFDSLRARGARRERSKLLGSIVTLLRCVDVIFMIQDPLFAQLLHETEGAYRTSGNFIARIPKPGKLFSTVKLWDSASNTLRIDNMQDSETLTAVRGNPRLPVSKQGADRPLFQVSPLTIPALSAQGAVVLATV